MISQAGVTLVKSEASTWTLTHLLASFSGSSGLAVVALPALCCYTLVHVKSARFRSGPSRLLLLISFSLQASVKSPHAVMSHVGWDLQNCLLKGSISGFWNEILRAGQPPRYSSVTCLTVGNVHSLLAQGIWHDDRNVFKQGCHMQNDSVSHLSR